MISLWLALGMGTALFLAWVNGSNNAANMVGTAVGSGAIDVRRALSISAISCFIGAMLLGEYVTDTVMRGIIDLGSIVEMNVIVLAMISVLAASSVWTLISTFMRIPMSVHACVLGSLIGAGLGIGIGFVKWYTLAKIFISWLLVVPITMVFAAALYKVVEKAIASEKGLRILVPTSSFAIASLPLVLSLLKSLSRESIALALTVSVSVGLVATAIVFFLWSKAVRGRGIDRVEVAMKILLIEAVIAMSFSFGSNDVANAAGPLAAILYAYGYHGNAIPIAVTIIGIALSLGIALWGSKVVETVGKKITPLSPLSAFVAQLTAAIVMVFLSRLGIPASTSMVIVGSVAGVGIVRGLSYVNTRVLAKIFCMWYAAIPCTAATAYILFLALSKL